MSVRLTDADEELASRAHPALRALREILIYLHDQPNLSPELSAGVEKLVSLTATTESSDDFIELEKATRRFIFRLEHADQQRDIGREAMLRRLLRNIFITLETAGAVGAEGSARFAHLAGEILQAPGIAEVEQVGAAALELVRQLAQYTPPATADLLVAFRDIAEQAVRALIADGTRSAEENAALERIADGVHAARAGDDVQELAAEIRRIAGAQDNLHLHRRIERLELQQIIHAIKDSLESLNQANQTFKAELDRYIYFISSDPGAEDRSDLQARTLLKSLKIQESIQHAETCLHQLQQRLSQSQSRIMLLDDDGANGTSDTAASSADTRVPCANGQAASPQELFEAELKIALENFTRHRTPHCLAMLKLENIHTILAQYGVRVKAKILSHLEQFLQSELRKIDVIVQLGEDLFGLILPNTTNRGAYLVMERIFLSIEAKQFVYKKQPIQVVSAVGICDLAPDMRANRWLLLALDAMRAASRANGIRVGIAGRDAVDSAI